MTTTPQSVSFLGLGAMGSQLAHTALAAGHPTSVWNRTAARVSPLVEEGAGGDYTVPGQQSLHFSDLTDIVNASRDQGISTEVVDMVQRLIHRQIDAGHGNEGFARIFESVRNGAAA